MVNAFVAGTIKTVRATTLVNKIIIATNTNLQRRARICGDYKAFVSNKRIYSTNLFLSVSNGLSGILRYLWMSWSLLEESEKILRNWRCLTLCY